MPADAPAEPAVRATDEAPPAGRTAGKPPAAPTNRLAFIDALRGAAALGVFMTHVHAFWLGGIRVHGMSPVRLLVYLAGSGGLGVDLFIVLSGFCLYFPIARKMPVSAAGLDARAFYKRRAYRLLPAYYVALSLAAGLALVPVLQPYLVGRPITAVDVVTHAGLVQIFSRSTMSSINGSFWSIALEMQLYVVFPVAVGLYARRGATTLLAVGATSTVLWWLGWTWMAGRGLDFLDPAKHLPARWIEFMLGMVAATLVAHPLARHRTVAWSLFAFLLPVTFGVTHTSAGRLPAFVGCIAAGITFAALVVALSALPERLFTRTPIAIVTRIGVISYSLYLIHQPFLLLTAGLARSLHLAIVPTIAISLLVALPVLCGLATVLFVTVERPCLERGRRLSRGNAQ